MEGTNRNDAGYRGESAGNSPQPCKNNQRDGGKERGKGYLVPYAMKGGGIRGAKKAGENSNGTECWEKRWGEEK